MQEGGLSNSSCSTRVSILGSSMALKPRSSEEPTQRPRRERSVAWPLTTPVSPNYGARTPLRPMSTTEPFDGAMPAGSSAWFCYGHGQCTAYGAPPGKPPCLPVVHAGLQRLSLFCPRQPLPRVHRLLVRGWLRHSPQIFTVFSIHLPGAAFLHHNCHKYPDLERQSIPFWTRTHHVKLAPLASVS